MTETGLARYAPLSGVAVVVFGGIATALLGSQPDFDASPSEIGNYMRGEGSLFAAGILYGLSSIALLWFAGSLRIALRAAEAAAGRLSALAFGGGVAASSLLLCSVAAQFTLWHRVDRDALDDTSAALLWDLGTMFFVCALFACAVLLFASALASLRFAALPRWLGLAAIVIGIGLLIPPISWAVFLGFLAWVLVTSVVLYLRGAGAAESSAAPPPSGPQ